MYCFVDKLQVEKIVHESAAEDNSYLPLVIGSDHLYPSGPSLVHCPGGAGYKLDSSLIPIQDEIDWDFFHRDSGCDFYKESSLQFSKICNGVVAFCSSSFLLYKVHPFQEGLGSESV